jgi:hypothetical protein
MHLHQLKNTRLPDMALPRPPPAYPGFDVSEDVLRVIMESEVALSYDRLWRAGLVRPDSRRARTSTAAGLKGGHACVGCCSRAPAGI